MCKEIKRTFRPAHRDLEVIFEDALGIEKRLYVGLVSPGVDVEAKIAAHFAEEDKLTEQVSKALGK